MSHRQKQAVLWGLWSLVVCVLGASVVYLALLGVAAHRAAAQDTEPAPEEVENDPLGGFPADYVWPVKSMPDSYMCGPVVLRKILRKWGDAANTQMLAAVAGTTARDGTSLLGLQQAALTRGVLATGVEMDYAALLDQVADRKVEVIVHLKPGHFCWARYANADGVALEDESSPASRWTPRADFEAAWSGKALLVRRPALSLAPAQ